jgi:type IV secretory pathway VirB10-like protein
MRSHDTHTRDSSLRRLSVINRWLIAASVTLTGVLTDVAAHAFPGKKSTPSTAKRGAQRAKHRPTKARTSTPAAKPQPPAQAPEARPESPAVEEPAPESSTAQQAPAEEPSAPVVSGGS